MRLWIRGMVFYFQLYTINIIETKKLEVNAALEKNIYAAQGGSFVDFKAILTLMKSPASSGIENLLKKQVQ